MEKMDEIFKAFEDAQKEAKQYFKVCEKFCNFLADRIKTGLGCQQDCEYGVQPERQEKQVVLTMSFSMPQGKTVPVRFIVKKPGDKFLVKIEGSGEEFTVPEKGSLGEHFARITDATYKWLKNMAIGWAWQIN